MEEIKMSEQSLTSIEHYAPASLKSYLGLMRFTEETREKNDSQGFIKTLLSDHESLIIVLREQIKSFAEDFHDAGSSDFITGLMEKHEKMAWFLRAHLQK